MGERNLLYITIVEDIQAKILNGKLKPGSAVTSENEIVKQYGVSRVTARRAFKYLIDKGILRTIQGKGTYVNDLEQYDWTWMKSFTEGVLKEGHRPTTRIIDFKEIPMGEHVAEKLKMEIGTPCYYFNRLRSIDNRPVWLTKTYIPCFLCEGLSPNFFSIAGYGQSIFHVLKQDFSVVFKEREEIQEAINIQGKDAELLQIVENKPVISKAMIAYGANKTPLLYENTVFEQTITKSRM